MCAYIYNNRNSQLDCGSPHSLLSLSRFLSQRERCVSPKSADARRTAAQSIHPHITEKKKCEQTLALAPEQIHHTTDCWFFNSISRQAAKKFSCLPTTTSTRELAAAARGRMWKFALTAYSYIARRARVWAYRQTLRDSNNCMANERGSRRRDKSNKSSHAFATCGSQWWWCSPARLMRVSTKSGFHTFCSRSYFIIQ